VPEIHFLVRWPDGSAQRRYSPATVVADHLVAGQTAALSAQLRARAAVLTADARDLVEGFER
jgi:uncharacterized repeat protein (TIGR04042 family)